MGESYLGYLDLDMAFDDKTFVSVYGNEASPRGTVSGLGPVGGSWACVSVYGNARVAFFLLRSEFAISRVGTSACGCDTLVSTLSRTALIVAHNAFYAPLVA